MTLILTPLTVIAPSVELIIFLHDILKLYTKVKINTNFERKIENIFLFKFWVLKRMVSTQTYVVLKRKVLMRQFFCFFCLI